MTGDGASFAIDADGQLKTKADLDHETKEQLLRNCVRQRQQDADGDADTPADDTHAVTITVTDVDEDGNNHILRGTTVGRHEADGDAGRR